VTTPSRRAAAQADNGDDGGGAHRVAFAPGRVNLIGDHTDYVGGLALPVAIQLGTTVDVRVGGDVVDLRSDVETEPAVVPIGSPAPERVSGWTRYVAAVVATCAPRAGAVGTVHTTLPVGAGLSSSAALEVATALALGCGATDPVALALTCQRAEHLAVGVPSGVMDQLASVNGRAGHALLMDFADLLVEPVPVPDGLTIWVVHSNVARHLGDTPYAQRRAEAERAVDVVGPLRDADDTALGALRDPVVRRRARHVVSENARVLALVEAFGRGDTTAAGEIMTESQRSLAEDMEVSTPVLDELVESLLRTPGVLGARLTGAGFGGCVVALARAGTRVEAARAWEVVPSDGARVSSTAERADR
jgi:galactokinase